MILPIVAYGDPVLKVRAKQIDKDFPNLKDFINNMWETMYNANGVGLAAPQIGFSIRVFIVDTSPFADSNTMDEDEFNVLKSFKKVMINPMLVEETGKEWVFNEGCLSIPEVRSDIIRLNNILIKYYDEDFKLHQNSYDGIIARVIQHEYDHIEGTLFTDKLSPLKRKLIKGKLKNISLGKVETDYEMKFNKSIKNR
tara:strand:+ start:9205 stop:9795 length:591 start_codon:yes stop_codon:yes gene_type:complete